MIKKQRSIEMHQLAERLKQEFAESQLGNKVSVLWERQRQEGALAKYSGYAPNFMKVETSVSNAVLLENRMVDTSLDSYSSEKQSLIGSV